VVDRLAGHGLEVVVPGAADRPLVRRVIYDELCLGVVREGADDVGLPAVPDHTAARRRRRGGRAGVSDAPPTIDR
jgi:aspartate/glutamate racemase